MWDLLISHRAYAARRYNSDWMGHISNEDLERYCLGWIKDEAELAPIEEHLLACSECVERAEQEQCVLDLMCGALKRSLE